MTSHLSFSHLMSFRSLAITGSSGIRLLIIFLYLDAPIRYLLHMMRSAFGIFFCAFQISSIALVDNGVTSDLRNLRMRVICFLLILVFNKCKTNKKPIKNLFVIN